MTLVSFFTVLFNHFRVFKNNLLFFLSSSFGTSLTKHFIKYFCTFFIVVNTLGSEKATVVGYYKAATLE